MPLGHAEITSYRGAIASLGESVLYRKKTHSSVRGVCFGGTTRICKERSDGIAIAVRGCRDIIISRRNRVTGGIRVKLVKNKLLCLRGLFWRHHPDLNWGIKLLQSFALPLGYGATHLSTLISVRCSRTSMSLERETRYSLPALTVEHCINQLRESCRFADSRTRGCRARRLCLYATRVLRCHWSERRDSNSRHLPWQGNALPLSHSRISFWWKQ